MNLRDIPAMVFLANPTSTHVTRWVNLLNHLHCSPQFVQSALHGTVDGSVGRVRLMRSYVNAGFEARRAIDAAPESLLHAHCAAGYGLSALLSGKRYLLTVYGTEIYSSTKKSLAHKWVLKRILTRALRISCTTQNMRDVLIERFCQEPSKIHCFSLGIDTEIFRPASVDRSAELVLGGSQVLSRPVFCVNRRIHPLYHTIEVLEAFLRFRERTKTGSLLLIAGDFIGSYLDRVRALAADNGAVVIVESLQNQMQMREWLTASDFSISMPDSDQLSASVLEAIACHATPILADLPAYAELFNRGLGLRCSAISVDSIFDAMLSAYNTTDLSRIRSEGWQYIRESQGDETALKAISDFYTVG